VSRAYVPDFAAPREQGAGRRWSWVPWTEEMEESCRGLKVRLRGWNLGIEEREESGKGKGRIESEEDGMEKQEGRSRLKRGERDRGD
jgi:hypothetical protein